MNKKMPIALIILDGFGYSENAQYNAIAQAHIPHFNTWFAHRPHTLLEASGLAVGLLEQLAGNSETGHLTIGSGRIIPQPIKIINDAIDDGSFFTLPALKTKLTILKKKNGTLHIMGLLSDGGVHSHEKHLYALIQAAIQQNVQNIVIHPFLDGRDVPPRSAAHYLERLEKVLKKSKAGVIGSVHGRWYAMDRDHNWERTYKTYNILTTPQNQPITDWQTVLHTSYEHNITDEFIEPTQLNPAAIIKPDDGIIFYNFRPDRARQLADAFVNPATTGYSGHPIPLSFFITPVSYYHYGHHNTFNLHSRHHTLCPDNTRIDVAKQIHTSNFNHTDSLPQNDTKNSTITTVLFETQPIKNTLKEILSNEGKTIFSIAETEKYAHVTYFFSGYKETPFPTETRHMIPSLHKKSYAKSPKMSALKITRTVIQSLTHNPHDFYLINYANADMVGHSGDFNATVKAVECLDKQLLRLYNHIVKKMNGILCITADHGKAECMFNSITGQPQTAHTTNKVPFIMVQKNDISTPLTLKQLSDIAPYILTVMKLPIPWEMNPSKDHTQSMQILQPHE